MSEASKRVYHAAGFQRRHRCSETEPTDYISGMFYRRTLGCGHRIVAIDASLDDHRAADLS
ncbi:MAG: hypothetical protein ABEH60_02120 [Halonotius sp.]